MGALHPVIFFMLVYGISLVLAIFVCRTVYFSFNKTSEQPKSIMQSGLSYTAGAINTTALK